MTASLATPPALSPVAPNAPFTRLLDPSRDAAALAQLMFSAYHGTIDDAGETIEDAQSEVAKLFAGVFGQLDPCSLVFAHGTAFASATIITRDALGPRGGAPTHDPFLAFSMTAPNDKRQGLARAGLTRVMRALAMRGEQKLHLVVTRANQPAVALYTSLGFVALD